MTRPKTRRPDAPRRRRVQPPTTSTPAPAPTTSWAEEDPVLFETLCAELDRRLAAYQERVDAGVLERCYKPRFNLSR